MNDHDKKSASNCRRVLDGLDGNGYEEGRKLACLSVAKHDNQWTCRRDGVSTIGTRTGIDLQQEPDQTLRSPLRGLLPAATTASIAKGRTVASSTL